MEANKLVACLPNCSEIIKSYTHCWVTHKHPREPPIPDREYQRIFTASYRYTDHKLFKVGGMMPWHFHWDIRTQSNMEGWIRQEPPVLSRDWPKLITLQPHGQFAIIKNTNGSWGSLCIFVYRILSEGWGWTLNFYNLLFCVICFGSAWHLYFKTIYITIISVVSFHDRRGSCRKPGIHKMPQIKVEVSSSQEEAEDGYVSDSSSTVTEDDLDFVDNVLLQTGDGKHV